MYIHSLHSPSQVILIFERLTFSSDLLASSPSLSMNSPLSPQRLCDTLRSLNDLVHGYTIQAKLCIISDHKGWGVLTSMAEMWWNPSWPMLLEVRLRTCSPSCCSAIPAQMNRTPLSPRLFSRRSMTRRVWFVRRILPKC